VGDYLANEKSGRRGRVSTAPVTLIPHDQPERAGAGAGTRALRLKGEPGDPRVRSRSPGPRLKLAPARRSLAFAQRQALNAYLGGRLQCARPQGPRLPLADDSAAMRG